ncbi:MAG: hypothetical protein HOU81_02515 [Hamadaea sp.]|uniref:hypothetical protein n=1 Tax=Hamadaea sp. TaxID=2024425 RepID=UPI00182117DF|nr:hypothetical protein [Hamadaea sp.]NUR69669.1 hypothetical protein [Hamadaea sp.]NUT19536.1 hypothetical protein [Hamadaea sp.]
MKRTLSRLAATLLATLALVTVSTAPSQAAVPDRKGWVLYNAPGASTVAFGTWPAATTVTPLAPAGRYQVRFPGQAAPGGVVHVTAINASPHWCQVEAWGISVADEIVILRCYKLGGILDPTSFSAFFTSSSGLGAFGPYGYAYSSAAGAVLNQYNSSGAANTVTPGPVGQYLVKFSGLVTGGPLDGSLQATAVNSGTGARCKIAKWSSTAAGQDVLVYCFNSAGAFMNTAFTVTYQYKVSLYGSSYPPKYFGYILNGPPIGPPTTNFNSVGGLGVNTIAPAGAGLSLVTFPRIGFPQNTVQVTAYGPSPDFCGLNTFWANFGAGPDTVVRDVICFTSAGAPSSNGFLVSASSIL